MKELKLVDISKEFAIEIINLNDVLKERGRANAILGQLLRSGTSIGANVHEANYAQSRADFLSKLQIALKECYETDYWLDIFASTSIITKDEYATLHTKCSAIRNMLLSSIKTTKRTN